MIRMDPEAERNLAAEDLARFSMYTCVKAVNTGGGCVTVQQIPRRSTANAEEEFKEFACILSSCASANGGIPPVSVAYDGHLSFSKVNAFLLGLLPPHAFADVPFFRECAMVTGGAQIPMFCFHAMEFRGQYKVFGCLDPKHILKALSRGIRTPGRLVELQPGCVVINHDLILSIF